MEEPRVPKLESYRNLSEAVYDTLKSAIVDNTLPAGHRLTEAAVATRLGVSATPVREALSRLASEGLVRLLPRRGATVSSFTADDILETCEVREELEALAIRKAIERGTPEVTAKLRAIVDSAVPLIRTHDQRAFNQLDVEFHRLIVNTSGNGRLIRFFEMLHDQIQTIRLRALHVSARPHIAQAEHEEILSAFADGSADRAAHLMRSHIRRAALALVYASSAKADKNADHIAGIKWGVPLADDLRV